jgi:2-polyprenyl-3-methyl-5-hydroxy-6-metoxy-1,4-benzoquinol methylase
MSVIKREFDIVGNSTKLEPIFELKKFPAFMGCVDKPQEEDVTHDLKLEISSETGMVQVSELLPLDVVYQNSHGQGTVGSLWAEHHAEFGKFIHALSPKKVFEIGGSTGILSDVCFNLDNSIDWTIIEPAPGDTLPKHAKLIKGFFDESIVIDHDMIVHSHVLEHIYDPKKFFDILSSIPLGTKMCFSIPNLQYAVEKRSPNVLNFEHTYFCIPEYVEYWLSISGFRLVTSKLYKDHSVFYSAIRDNVTPLQLPNLYEKNYNRFQDYWTHHCEDVAKLNNIIGNSKKPVFLFGGHVFSQFLLCAGLDEQKISSILDNDCSKHGKRLYGSSLHVQSTKVLENLDAIVILRAGTYSEEIKRDILSNINSKTEFI